MSSIAIIDYGLGNVRSVNNALVSQEADTILTSDPEAIMASNAIVLPGVGSFPYAVQQLHERKLFDVVGKFAATGKPVLGICLGMQLLLTVGEEFRRTDGLGLIDGAVVPMRGHDDLKGRLPHVGWSPLNPRDGGSWSGTIFDGLKAGVEVYFVHSFMAAPKHADDVLAITPYQGLSYCSAVQHGNIAGCQFHPEKSGPAGLSILRNFIELSNASV